MRVYFNGSRNRSVLNCGMFIVHATILLSLDPIVFVDPIEPGPLK